MFLKVRFVPCASSTQPIMLALLCTTACGSSLGPQEDDLSRAEARWRATAIRDYSFEFQRGCFCLPAATRTITITVHQAACATVTYADDGAPADTSLFRDFLTIDRFFSFLRQTLQQRPTSFVASYDAQIGYPIRASIDYKTNIADDEFSFQVLTFAPQALRRYSEAPPGTRFKLTGATVKELTARLSLILLVLFVVDAVASPPRTA